MKALQLHAINLSHLENPPSPCSGVQQGGFFKWLFLFLTVIPYGGITHPLRMWMRQTQINVLNRACISCLTRLGVVKTLEGLTPFKLDKREHLSCG